MVPGALDKMCGALANESNNDGPQHDHGVANAQPTKALTLHAHRDHLAKQAAAAVLRMRQQAGEIQPPQEREGMQAAADAAFRTEVEGCTPLPTSCGNGSAPLVKEAEGYQLQLSLKNATGYKGVSQEWGKFRAQLGYTKLPVLATLHVTVKGFQSQSYLPSRRRVPHDPICVIVSCSAQPLTRACSMPSSLTACLD